MLFNSFAFAIFFPIVLILYWLLRLRGQNIMLLVASYFFYGYWDWRFLSLLALSTTLDYFVGLKVHELRDRTNPATARKQKIWFWASITANLGILGFFKYFNFFIDSMSNLLIFFHLNPISFHLNIVLPVGISFYTFQTMSYVIDVYRGKLEPARKFLDFALYVSFFPQLVAGPIERASNLLPRLINKRTFDLSQFQEGLHLILLGLFKKVYVADNLAPYVEQVFSSPNPTALQVLFGGWAFAFQVYGDFSGYSDIARGTAKCMGIELMINFNHPYVAVNPTERWQRWHISLSTWLRDYLYIPLGGSRHGELKTYRNLGLTMLLGGLWHGAAWNFVLWGAWEGLMLIVHRLCAPWMQGITLFKKYVPNAIRRFFKMFIMFQLVSIGLIIFRSHSVSHMWQMLTTIFSWQGVSQASILLPLLHFMAPLIIFEGAQYAVSRDQWNRIEPIPIWIKSMVYAVMFYLLAFHGASAQSFIYFQF